MTATLLSVFFLNNSSSLYMYFVMFFYQKKNLRKFRGFFWSRARIRIRVREACWIWIQIRISECGSTVLLNIMFFKGNVSGWL